MKRTILCYIVVLNKVDGLIIQDTTGLFWMKLKTIEDTCPECSREPNVY